MKALDIPIDDPSDLSSEPYPFEGQIHQVGRGPLAGRAVGFLGDALDVWIYSMGQATQVQSALRPGRVVLTTPLSLDRPGRHNGREIPNGDLVEFEPGLENTETWGAGLILDLQIEPSLAMERGWSRGGESVRRLSTGDRDRIRAYCERRLALKADQEGAEVAKTDVESGEALKADRAFVRGLIALLDSQTLPVVEPRADHARHRLARRALELIEASLDDEPLSVPRLAESVGVSERTVYDAFAREVGTSPYDYILIRRLNRFRRLLLQEPRRHGAVTQAATRAGFDHLSQLTRLYRRLFGELPRETLRRRAA